MYTVVFGRETLVLPVDHQTVDDLREAIACWTGLHHDDYYLTRNGKAVRKNGADTLEADGAPLRLFERLPGGKGGFGSMLRAIGAQIEKTTNREACRDLSGRRLRDINEEKRLKAYLDKQQDAPEDERAKLQKKVDKLLAKPKHEFHDREYERMRSDLTVQVDAAVEEGFKKAAEAERFERDAVAERKRKQQTSTAVKKKKAKGALWLGTDDLSSSSETDADSDSEDASGSSSSPKGQIVSDEEKNSEAVAEAKAVVAVTG